MDWQSLVEAGEPRTNYEMESRKVGQKFSYPAAREMFLLDKEKKRRQASKSILSLSLTPLFWGVQLIYICELSIIVSMIWSLELFYAYYSVECSFFRIADTSFHSLPSLVPISNYHSVYTKHIRLLLSGFLLFLLDFFSKCFVVLFKKYSFFLCVYYASGPILYPKDQT